MKRTLLSALALAATCAWANTTQTVSQVTTSVTVDPDVDYVVTSATPFGADGRIELSGNSTLILKNVIPSQALQMAGQITIDGAAARNGSNCMFKVYGGGTIVLAHGSSIQPFTAYTESNQNGESKSYSVGARLSLAGTSMNNNIASFTLRRGYMVCLANQSDGTGYSRVFVADTQDRKVNLPAVLKDKVSSLRVMQWNDCGKRGYSGGDATVLDALNVSWFYDWNCGGTATSDWEYVPQHHHEGWPSISDIGASQHSPHALGNNEPDNTGDAREQVNTVDEVLAHWPEMMATGKRLGSPAVSGNYNWLYAFIDSIDARGWRCDFIAVHAYWYSDWSSWNSTLQGIANRTGRPIWITEMNYGANWTGWPGSDTSGSDANFAIEKQHFAPVIDGLEASDYLERYAVYNWVQDCRSMYLNGKLTPMGEYYANVETHVGYKPGKEKIPSAPKQFNPADLSASYDKSTHQVTLSWKDRNGEYNQLMEVQYQKPGNSIWSTIDTIAQQEQAASYQHIVTGLDGYKYRIRVTDLNNRERLSNEATAVNENLEVGDEVTLDDQTFYLGGNQLVNGSFEFGLADWTNGAGEPLSAPYFQAASHGYQGSYLQCYGNGDKSTTSALRKVLHLESGASYYVSATGCYGDPSNQRISTTSRESLELNVRVSMPAVSEWARQGAAFTVTSDTLLLIQMRKLGGKAMLDEMMVARLFPTREEALADALVWSRRRAELLGNVFVSTLAATTDDALAIERYIRQALNNRTCSADASRLTSDARMLIALHAPGYEQVENCLSLMQSADDPYVWESYYTQLSALMSEYWSYTRTNENIQNPAFASASGWNTLAGTYKGGDQRTATQAGKTCWNAWWNIPASQQETMAVNQQVLGLKHGLYALECKATTQHLCETDQHAFLQVGKQQAVSSALDDGLLDLPVADADKWITLPTSWLYVSDGDTVTIGFEGSKSGAVDGSWIPYANPDNKGDNRNGWWCATDFRFRYIPVARRTPDASRWGTICLANEFEVNEDIELYQIAGILGDSSTICLEPLTSFEPGTPCIYRLTKGEDAYFFEGERKVSSPVTNYHGLRGALSTTSKYPVGSLYLQDGVWHHVATSADRFSITPYSAYIQKVSNLTVLDSWSGVTLPTQGLASALDAVSADAAAEGIRYNVAGQRVSSPRGLTIRQGVIILNK